MYFVKNISIIGTEKENRSLDRKSLIVYIAEMLEVIIRALYKLDCLDSGGTMQTDRL